MSRFLSNGRGNNFDAIRFALAAIVIASHSFPLLEGGNAKEPLMRLTGGQVTGGELAVSGFFALSGFLIAQSWERSRSSRQFFRKRILRIYPGFIVAVLFGALIVAPQIASSSTEYWQQFSATKLLGTTINLDPRLPKVFNELPVPAVNGSLWSIRYEFCCYVGLALAGWIGAFQRRRIMLAAFVLLMAAYAAQLWLNFQIPGGGLGWLIGDAPVWPRLGALYLSGVLLHLYRDRIAFSPRLCAISIGLIGLAAILSQYHCLPLLLPLFGTYALFAVAFLPIPRLPGFAKHGDFSYGLYLYAFPVQQWLVHCFGSDLNPGTLFLAAFPLTLVMAMLSWYLVERPFAKPKAKKASGVIDRHAAKFVLTPT